MHYDRHYAIEAEPDAAAMRDICEYLSKRQWDMILELARDPKTSCRELDFFLCLTGVQGYPNHAFIRTMRPEQYDAWFDSLPEA